jgi:STE24 endopeptidase
MRLRKLALLLCLALPIAARASETPTEHAANIAAAQEMAAAPIHGNLPDYSLPPDQLTKAQHLSRVRVILHCGSLLWNIAVFAILLWYGVVAWIRDRAIGLAANLRANGNRIRAFFLECLLFTLLYNLLSAILDLPLSIYSHILSVENGLSIQGWPSWFGDWSKSIGLGLLGSFLIYALLMSIIRRFPRSWWLVCWGAAAPLMILIIYAAPLVIDPRFNKFEPLQKTNPALVQQLEKVVARGNMNIPPDRMFLMKASAKVTTMNAYVTGFGSSKRVVVWDTSLQKGTPDEVLFIFGHESGHYVLGHVLRGVLMIFFGLFVALYLGYLFVNWSLTHFGGTWHIPSQSDWGALVVLFFAFTLFTTLIEPITNAISRNQEHAADVYGQEAIHGIVSNPQQVAIDAFQVLGSNSLDEPNTPPFVEFWMENHPSTGRRAAFAAHYDPWAPNAEPKYFSRQTAASKTINP